MSEPTVISWFDAFDQANEHAFLSNFYAGQPIAFHGRLYRTGEHLFQAFKATTRAQHEEIVSQPTPAEAKAWGRRLVPLRPDWERVKYDVMRLVLTSKFRLGREEGPLLLATGDALLVEGTHWGDEVWGVDLKKGREVSAQRAGVGMAWEDGEGWEDAPGRNWLGTLLMARRTELYFQQRDTRGTDAIQRSVASFAMDVPSGRRTPQEERDLAALKGGLGR